MQPHRETPVLNVIATVSRTSAVVARMLRRVCLGGQQLEAGASGISAFKSEEDEGREAIRLDPKNQPAYLHVGGSLVVQQKFAEALAPLQQAVRLKVQQRQ